MVANDMNVRQMRPQDLDFVLHIQAASHGSRYLEPRQSFVDKLNASPATTWLACRGQEPLAYLFALPIDDSRIPTLHQTGWTPPPHPRWLYLHDLAVLPGAQGGGTGKRLVAQAFLHARRHGLHGLALVAIPGASGYWCRQGFSVRHINGSNLRSQVTSYGRDAMLMFAECPAEESPVS